MKRVPWRSLLYAAVFLYLLMDLRWCGGPLQKTIAHHRKTTSVENALRNGWVAIVNQEPVTRPQLDLALVRYLYQRGKKPEDIPEATLKVMRRAVMQTLINDTLVRQYADGEKFTAPQGEVDRFIQSWESQFASEEEREERSEIQSLSPRQRLTELARIWSRKRWLENRIKPGIAVTDDEIRQWFETNRKTGRGFMEPEKLRARQIFVSTVEVDDESREKIIRNAYRQLTDPENPADFAELAGKISDDEASKTKGGDLNWFSRNRMPGDFWEKVVALKKNQISQPFRTRIGWHIVQVLEREKARPARFEDLKDEIRAHLENERRVKTIRTLMSKLRKVARIELFPENM